MKATAATTKQSTVAAPARAAVATPAMEPTVADPMGALDLQRIVGNRATRRLLHTEPLPDAGRWSQRLHADLSRVRIATGPDAERATAAMNARALTLGQTVLFGTGAYQPGTPDGQHLLAHELAHTLQNAGASTAVDLPTTRPGDAREQEAHRVADAVAAGLRPPRIRPGPTMLAGDWRTAARPARPQPWESTLLAILDTTAADDQVAAASRRAELLAALGAVPEPDRPALLARLEHPASGDRLAQLFNTRLAPQTAQAALRALRPPGKPVDEKTLSEPLRKFVAGVTVQELPPPPVIDQVWRREAQVIFKCAGARAPQDGSIDLEWKIVDRAGTLGGAGRVAWPAGAEASPRVTTQLAEPGLWLLVIDLVTRGQVIKQITHLVTVSTGSGIAALRGTSRAERAAAAARLSDEQIAEQAHLLRDQLKAFDGRPGSELTGIPDYQQAREALDALEWQAALRATPGHIIDTAAPTFEDVAPTKDNPVPLLDSVDRHDRAAVRARVEALIRRYGMAGARKQILRARNIRSDLGTRPGITRSYFEFEQELDAFAALYKDLPGRVELIAADSAKDMLKTNREVIEGELTRYGIVKVGDHRMGIGAYRSGPNNEPNQALLDLGQELHKLAELKRRVRGPRLDEPWLQPLPKEERRAAEEEYELALRAALIRFPALLVFTEAARNPTTPHIWDSSRFPRNEINFAPWIGWELNQKLRDIETAKHKIDNDDKKLNLWSLRPVIETTKHKLGIAPGTVASAVVDDYRKEPSEGGWTDSLLTVFTIALGALLAIPTGGASLIVVAGELTLLAADLYMFHKQLSAHGELQTLANTAIDPSRALLAEVPESADLILAMLALPVAGGSAMRAVRQAKDAATSIRSLRSALARRAGDVTHPEVIASMEEVRASAMKAFHNDAPRADAYVKKLMQRLGKRTPRIAVELEHSATVVEYGAEVVARRVGVARITVVKDLEKVASVHAVENGGLVVAEIRVSQATTVQQLLDHARSAKAIERYNGIIGKLRLVWDHTLDKLMGGGRVNPYRLAPSSPEFRVFEEVRKHEIILRARMKRLASVLDKGDDHAAAVLRDEIAHYEGEAAYWQHQLNEITEGRGTKVSGGGIEARTPKDVQAEASRKGYKPLEGKRYRRTGSTAPGREFEPYEVQSGATELDAEMPAVEAAATKPIASARATAPRAIDPGGRGVYALDDAKIATLPAPEAARLRVLQARMPASPEELQELIALRKKANGGVAPSFAAGTPEHTLDAWKRYQSSDRPVKQSFERWMAGHPSRMANPVRGGAREAAYRSALDDAGLEARNSVVETPGGQKRQVDALIDRPDGTRDMLQIKAGKESLDLTARESGGASRGSSSLSNADALQADAGLMTRGDRVTWVFEELPTGPLVKRARELNIGVVIRVRDQAARQQMIGLMARAKMSPIAIAGVELVVGSLDDVVAYVVKRAGH